MMSVVIRYIQLLIEGVSRGSLSDWSTLIQTISNNLFGILCHQDPSILIQLQHKLILLCPRCIGLHVGFASSVFLFSIIARRYLLLSHRMLVTISIAVLVTAIHWLLGTYNIVEQNSGSRLLTGVISGSAIGVLFLFYRSKIEMGSKKGFLHLKLVHLLCSIFISFIVLYSFRSINHWSITSAALVILVLFNFYQVISTIIIRSRSLVSFIFSNHSSITFLKEIHHEHKN